MNEIRVVPGFMNDASIPEEKPIGLKKRPIQPLKHISGFQVYFGVHVVIVVVKLCSRLQPSILTIRGNIHLPRGQPRLALQKGQ